jgi:hypothetical protein
MTINIVRNLWCRVTRTIYGYDVNVRQGMQEGDGFAFIDARQALSEAVETLKADSDLIVALVNGFTARRELPKFLEG